MNGRIKSLNKDYTTGKSVVTFEIDEDISELCDRLQGKDVQIKIEEYKKKRSNNANSYLWALCGQIAEAVGNITSVDVYRRAVKESGIYKDFEGLTQSSAKTLAVAWHRMGIGWTTEQLDFDADGESVIIRCYYGTSCYTSKQIARVIDNIEQEAKQVGVPTLADEKMKQLLNEWKGEAE